MLFKSIILCLLVALPALGSAIKGYSRAEEPAIKGLHREEPTKGSRLLAPAEQLRADYSKTHQKLEIKEEQRVEEFQQQREHKYEDVSQLKQEHDQEPLLTQQRVEHESSIKATRYEAKPQIREEIPLAKGQKQPLAAPPAAPFPEQKVELLESAKGQRVEQYELKSQAKQEPLRKEPAFEQQQERVEQAELHQQVEIRQEPQEQQLLAVEEIQQVRQEPIVQAVKGGGPAPLGQAEPYAFEYAVDGSSRRESGDINGYVRGQYTLQGADGSSRIVDYVADANGFRASVNTNEFGTEARSPAAVDLHSSQPEAQDISLRLEGKTREFLNPPQPQQAPLLAVKGAPAWPTKTVVQREERPQQLLVQADLEAPRATKGVKVEEPRQLPIKAPLPLAASKSESEPREGQVELIQATGPVEHRPLADYRAPRPLPVVSPIRASTFESATAHRVHPIVQRAPVAIVHQHPAVPAIPVRPVAPARSHYRQPPAPQRAYYQPERNYLQPAVYRAPVAPIRSIIGEQQPRALNLDDETLNLSFDRSS